MARVGLIYCTHKKGAQGRFFQEPRIPSCTPATLFICFSVPYQCLRLPVSPILARMEPRASRETVDSAVPVLVDTPGNSVNLVKALEKDSGPSYVAIISLTVL